jgi:hypothetical protein
MNQDKDWVEYNWHEFYETGERWEEASLVYENELGEESVETYPQPMRKPEADETLRTKYFADLTFWIDAEYGQV